MSADATDVDAVPAELGDSYFTQADRDPRSAGGGYVFMELRPRRDQAWRENNEIAGRTLMCGAWTVSSAEPSDGERRHGSTTVGLLEAADLVARPLDQHVELGAVRGQDGGQ